MLQVEDNRKFRIHVADDKVLTSPFIAKRSVFCKAQLPRGRYVIIPCTEKPGITGNFLLRTYSGGDINTR